MTFLPQKPAFNPWQQALYGLSSGLMAAGAPGGFRNFGAGVGQGVGQFQDQQSRLVREQMLQKQFERDEADAAAKQAATEAEKKRIAALSTNVGGLLATYDDDDTSNDAFGALSPAQLSLARVQLESNPEGLLETLGGWAKPADGGKWQITDALEGSEKVTYRINPMTGEKEEIGRGPAYAPQQGDGGPKTSLVPFITKDAQGKLHMWQPTSTGQPIEIQLPPDQQFAPNQQFLNTGTAFQQVDTKTGAQGASIPIDVGGEAQQRAAGGVVGEAQGTATSILPEALAKAEQAQALIKKIREHPGKAISVGGSSVIAGGLVPAIPGSANKDFLVAMDQLKGKTFLEAYQSLKGGGAITVIEGQKGEEAIARLNTAQSEPEFDAALNELSEIIDASIARMKAKAKGSSAPSGPQSTAPSQSNIPAPPAGFEPLQ